MKQKNLFALTIIFFLHIISIRLVASEKHKQLNFCISQEAQANAVPYKPFPQIPFNSHQSIQEQNTPSFKYCELDQKRFKKIIANNPNTKDANGITPLYWACCTNNLETVQSLLNNTHTKPNIRVNGRTVLHIACEWGNVDLVKLLLTNDKTDPNIKTSWESSALDIAHNRSHHEIIQLLLAHQNIQENTENTPNSNSDLTDQNIMTTEDTISYEDTDNSGRAQLVRLLRKNYQYNSDIKISWDNTELTIARNKRFAKIKQLLKDQQNTKNNNRDKTIEVLPSNTDTNHNDGFAQRNMIIHQLATKKVQQNWLRSKLHSLRKTISQNTKALYQTFYNNRSETTQLLSEQKIYHNTTLDNERSNALSKYILRFIVYPNLALTAIVMTGCIVFIKYVR